jgi:prophage antirepressor-like protein
MSKRTRIDTSREIRLWLGQVIVPSIMTAGMLSQNELVQNKAREVKNFVVGKIGAVKNKFAGD